MRSGQENCGHYVEHSRVKSERFIRSEEKPGYFKIDIGRSCN